MAVVIPTQVPTSVKRYCLSFTAEFNMTDERKKATAANHSESVGNLSCFNYQVVQGCMEMDGRGIFYKNTSEEMFMKALMDNSLGMPTPTMDVIGFRNLSHNFRADSEELFKSWLTNAESHGYNSPSMTHRSRQITRRVSTEMAILSSQPHGDIAQSKLSNESSFTQNGLSLKVNDIPPVASHDSTRNAVESGWQASNLYLAKAWFHSSQPMTRSRSSELRKRYAAMNNGPTTFGIEAMQNAQVVRIQQEFATTNPIGFTESSLNEIPGTFISPSNSSSSTFNQQPVINNNMDRVSSVVSMLKGTLERKKLGTLIEKQASEEYFSQGGISGALVHDRLDEGIIDIDFEGFADVANLSVQQGAVSQEPSQSESSAAAPNFDEPATSNQAPGICQSSRNHVSSSAEIGSKCKASDFRDRIMDNLKNEKKRGNLVRYGSVTSIDSGDKADPTKKRRVERSRKMAEAKERNSTATIPSDMQSILKRCDNLEKEVRSLKLNLSFMNRKDSEQTKQIEELQQQNNELGEEKERLLEEIERILGGSGV